MSLSQRSKRRVRLYAVLVALSAALAPLYHLLVTGAGRENPVLYLHSSFSALIIGGLGWAFILFFVPSRLGAPLRRSRFLVNVLVHAAVLAACATIGIIAELSLLHSKLDLLVVFKFVFLEVLVFIFVLVTVIYIGVRIVGIIGARTLFNILTGRYHRPLREDRVFMFLDLAGSTALAQRLGDIGVQDLIGRFFFDISEPILESGGEIHRYIGDEVVVTWPLRQGAANLRSVRCYFAIVDLIAARATAYRRDHDAVPEFRAGIHGGPVVAAQCGDYKQEIVYFGDTVNTAARLQQQCKAFDCPLLVSDQLLARMAPGDEFEPRRLGRVRLRGREQETELFTIDRENAR